MPLYVNDRDADFFSTEQQSNLIANSLIILVIRRYKLELLCGFNRIIVMIAMFLRLHAYMHQKLTETTVQSL